MFFSLLGVFIEWLINCLNEVVEVSIIDNIGKTIYSNEVKVNNSLKDKVELKLSPGKYYLRLRLDNNDSITKEFKVKDLVGFIEL